MGTRMSNQTNDDEKLFQVSQKISALMQGLSIPKTNKEVIELLRNYLGFTEAHCVEVMDYLLKEDLLISHDFNLRNQTALYSNAYSNPDSQRSMLLDLVRTDLYRRAIEQVASKGSVIDVGCGSGILSMFSASAGARKIYAIEATQVINLAQRLAKANNFSDKIEFINDYAQNVALNIKADLIVSEWMGYFAIEEYMFDAVQVIRDRYLAKGGMMMPSAVNLYLAPVENRELYYKKGPGFWNSTFLGYDFNVGVSQESANDVAKRCIVPMESLIALPALLLHFDCLKDNTSAFHFTKDVEWVSTRDAFLHGFCGYFDAILTDKITLSTSPMSPNTHWQQVYFPIKEIWVKKSDRIQLNITTNPGSICPTIALKGSIIRDNSIIEMFHSKPFVDGFGHLG